MAKKSRKSRARARSAGSQAQRSNIAPVQPVQRQQGTRASARLQPAAVAAVFRPDQYAYVINDLKIVGIIAGSLIVILIILTFILH